MYVTYSIEGLYNNRLHRGLKKKPAKKPFHISFTYARVRATKRKPPIASPGRRREAKLRRLNMAIAIEKTER